MITQSEELSKFAGDYSRRLGMDCNPSVCSFDRFDDFLEYNPILSIMICCAERPLFLCISSDDSKIFLHNTIYNVLSMPEKESLVMHELMELKLKISLGEPPTIGEDNDELLHPIVELLSWDGIRRDSLRKVISSYTPYMRTRAVLSASNKTIDEVFDNLKSVDNCLEESESELFRRFSVVETLLEIVGLESGQQSRNL